MSPILFALFVVVLIACVVRYSRSRPPSFPPGPFKLPIWGNLWQVLTKNYEYPQKALRSMANANKDPVLGLMLGDIPVVVANDYQSVREMLEKPEFQGRPDTFLVRVRADNFKPYGIFFTDGDYWSQQRRFSLRHLRDFGFGRRFPKHEGVVLEEVQNLVNVLKGLTKESSLHRDGRVHMPGVFHVSLMNSLMEVLFGSRLPAEDFEKALSVARDAMMFQRNASAMGTAVEVTPWLRYLWPNASGWKNFKRGNDSLRDFLETYIKDQKGSFEEEELRGFVDVFLSEMKKREGEGSSFTYRQLLLTVTDYMIPTATAVPSALTFAVLFMVRHPDKVERAHAEIAAVVGRDKLPDLNDRSRLPYTEAFLREVLRLTGTPLTVTHRATEGSYFRGYFVPENTLIVPNLWAAHRDPRVFDRPGDFMPERFLHSATGELKSRDPTMSFGLGKRLCAGETFARQTLFVFLAALIQNFIFTPPEGEIIPTLDEMLYGLTFTPKEFWIEVSERL